MRGTKQYPEIPGVVVIAGELHCKNREAFDALMSHLAVDYDIKDCMKNETHPHPGYYCHIKDTVAQRFAKCDHCGHLNTTLGCKKHGFVCAGCNQIIYRYYLPKGLIRFTFHPEKREHGFGCIAHEIHYYDHEAGVLYLKPEQPEDYNGSFSVYEKEKAAAYLAEYSDYYTVVERDGEKLLAIPFPDSGRLKDERSINPWEVSRWHAEEYGCEFTEVTHYKGTEYRGFSGYELPVPDSYMVHESYAKPGVPTCPSQLPNQKLVVD